MSNNLIADTKLAIELEKKGYDFYATTAKRSNNPLAVSTLNGLAERELLHIERITQFYQDLTGEKSLPADWLKNVEVPPTKLELIKPILHKLEISLNQKFESEKSIEEAYAVAKGLERDSYSLYDRIAAESTDETTRKFFSSLAKEEKEHFAILEETLQYLDNPGEWYRKAERWIVEG